MHVCSRCGKTLNENETCDCLIREMMNRLDYEMRYSYHGNQEVSAPKKSNTDAKDDSEL